MPEKIFLSYAHKDSDLASDIQKRLRESGIISGDDVIIMDPHKLTPGMDYRQMIKDKMNLASKVVIIASPNSVQSEWVNYEAGMASALEKPIFIVGLKGSDKWASQFTSLENVRSIEIGGSDFGGFDAGDLKI